MALFIAAALLVGLAAIPGSQASAQGQAQQSVAERCFERHQFGARPVDVAKTADGQTVLAQTTWGWHDSIGCYLSLDDPTLAVLRAAAPPQSLPDAATEVSQRCFERHQFGARPVDVAKTADGQTVLARLSWGYHDSIGCYLVLDDDALAALRTDRTNSSDTTDTDKPQAASQLAPVAAGAWHSCALKANQTIACWGANRSGLLNAPAGQHTSIAAGNNYSCALRTDQTIVCWGDNWYGQTDAPPGQYTAIAASSLHSCALKADQTIVCWGQNSVGKTDAPAGQYTAIAAGSGHSCAIKTDQTITCWGNHVNGETDAPAGRYTAITAGDNYSCALRADQTITCWGGLNRYGKTDAPPGQYTAIAAGIRHSCAIRADQTITCWGDNQAGQTDAPPGHYTAIAAGSGHSCAIKTDQTITCWGSNLNGQTDAPSSLTRTQEQILSVKVFSESEPEVGAGRTFEVTVEFNRPVSDFDADDMNIVNGDVTRFAGSGSRYEATITAAELGTVVVLIPTAAASDQNGHTNDPSQPFVRAVRTAVTVPNQFFDTWNREAVLAEFNAEFDRQEPHPGWAGDLSRCIAGTTSQQYRDSVIQRVNWYRQMAGVLPIAEGPALSRTAQSKALIMAAEGRLSHLPGRDWVCYAPVYHSPESLALGYSGVDSIDGYIRDSGSNNKAVGHRRMIIYREMIHIGTGDIPGKANALHGQTSSDQGRTREQRGFVAWPSPGYVPHVAVWGRWSFTLPNADFSNAAVAVIDSEGPVEAQIIDNQSVAEPGIVWAMDRDRNSDPHPPPLDGDRCYAVTISGVKIDGESQTPYEYATCVIGVAR